MPRAELGATGAVISPTEGPELTETAVALEALGFPTIWLTGGPLASLDQVAAVVRATDHVTVSTGILAVVRWTSDDVGALYDQLEASHPGTLRGRAGRRPRTPTRSPPSRPTSTVSNACPSSAACWPPSGPACSAWPPSVPAAPSRWWSPPTAPPRSATCSAPTPRWPSTSS